MLSLPGKKFRRHFLHSGTYGIWIIIVKEKNSMLYPISRFSKTFQRIFAVPVLFWSGCRHFQKSRYSTVWKAIRLLYSTRYCTSLSNWNAFHVQKSPGFFQAQQTTVCTVLDWRKESSNFLAYIMDRHRLTTLPSCLVCVTKEFQSSTGEVRAKGHQSGW